jgi:Zn-dependent protease
MDADILLRLLVVFVPLLLSLTVHEASHALAAWWLGDDTAQRQGRLSLNPIVHVDLFGTVILPLMLVLSNAGFFFGWAKPVPVSPVNFRRGITMRTGMMITAAAGPASNILLAIASVAFMKVLLVAGVVSEPVFMLLYQMVSINLILALFNLIPFPPLDGSKVLQGLLPHKFSNIYGIFEQNPWLSLVGFFVIIKFAGVVIGPPYKALLGGLLNLFGIYV